MTTTKLYQNQMTSAEFYGSTLIFNGGFENWDTGIGPFIGPNMTASNEWFVLDNSVEANLTRVSRSAPGAGFSGSFAAHIQVIAGAGSSENGIWQTIQNPMEFIGKPLTFSAYVNTATAAKVRLSIWWWDVTIMPSGGWVKVYSDFHPGGSVWSLLSVHTFIDEFRAGRLGLPPGAPDPNPNQPIALVVDVVESSGDTADFFVDEAVCVAGLFHDGPAYVPYEPVGGATSDPGKTDLICVAPVSLYDLVCGVGPGVMPADISILVLSGGAVGFATVAQVPPNAVPVQYAGVLVNPGWAVALYPAGPPMPLVPWEPVYAFGPIPGVVPPPLPGGIFQFSTVNVVYPLFTAFLFAGPPGSYWIQQVGMAVGTDRIEVELGEVKVI